MRLSDNISTDSDMETEETSEYIVSGTSSVRLGLDTLASEHFSNIHKMYSSPSNPTEIFSAIRYGKRYTLKCISEDFREDPIQNFALSKEFEIGLSLDHPNIRQTIGYENVEGLGKAIILEYFDGEPLDKFICTKAITTYQARTIAGQIASAIKYIHSKQIIHKDLKLSNILISHHGLYVKIIDFNLSDSDSFIILKNPAGSRKYMAPELKEASAFPSILTDIYSFGIIIKELAEASGDTALLKIAEKCASGDPSKRPQSVNEIQLPDAEIPSTSVLSHFLSTKIATYIFSIICVLLSVLIFHIAWSKHII